MNNSVLRTKKWEAEKKTVLTRMAKQIASGEFGMNVEKMHLLTSSVDVIQEG